MKRSRRRGNNEHASKGSLTGAIIIMAAVFIVTVLNFIYLSNILRNQVVDLGNQVTDNMLGSLQDILEEASYMTRVVAVQTEDMLADGATKEELKEFFNETSKRQSILTDGSCINVCFTSPGNVIVPGADIGDDFDISTRPWYQGVIEQASSKKLDDVTGSDDIYVYVSEPYVDYASGIVCFTSAVLLSDGKSTVSLDFKMDKTQELIASLGESRTESYIVNSEGLLVGCNNEEYLGTKASEHYPFYVDVIKNTGNNSEKIGHFTSNGKAIFYCNADDKWYLISVVDQSDLFKDAYISMLRNAIISSILLIAIVVLLIWNIRGRRKVQKALNDRENFFNNISGELKQPVAKILHESNPLSLEESVDVNDNMKSIRESAMKLSGLVDNILAYSGIEDVPQGKDGQSRKGRSEEKNTASIRLGVLVIVIIAVCLGIIVWFSNQIIRNQAKMEMERIVEEGSAKLGSWMSARKSQTDMLAKNLESNPELLNDYEALEKYLAAVQSKSEDVELIYVGNENMDPCVAMSDGWVPGIGYVVQAYSWYLAAVESDTGYAISQPYFDTTVRAFCITISEPMYDEKGNFLGVLGMDYSIEELTELFDSEYSEKGYSFLVTNSGLIVNHPNRRYAISPSNRVDVRDLNYQKVFGTDKYVYLRDYDGRIRLCKTKKDDISGFRVFAMRDAVDLFMQTGITGILFIVQMSVCLVIIIVIWRRLTKWYENGNEKLRLAAERATEADKAKMQFLAQISHELRTPINAVLGMDELITRESDDDNIIGYAEDIQTAGHNLLELVNGLLDFSKIENGKMTLQEVEYSTEHMLRETLNTVIERANKAGLELIVEVDNNLSSLLYGDDMKIRQVVVNLLTNAIKYTPKGKVILTVKEQERIDDTVIIYFAVKDTGIGIKPEDRDNLFKSFSRVDQEKNRSIEGTGLGLYIVNKILAMMNSKLELDSVYGKGSTFYFAVEQKVISTLPIGEFSIEHGKASRKAAGSLDYVYAPDAKIMIVDDNSVNLKVAAGLLKRSGAKVSTINNGKACLDVLREKKDYDIIFLDHMMPNMDGVEVLRHIREEDMVPENCPVIVMTANAITGVREEYINMGFDDYISKPIDVAVLEDTLDRWLPKDKKSKRGGAADNTKAAENIKTAVDIKKAEDVKKSEGVKATEDLNASEGNKPTEDIKTTGDIKTTEDIKAQTTSDTSIMGEESAETPGVFYFEMDESGADETSLESDEFSEEEVKYFAEKVTEIDLNTGLSFAAGSKSFYLDIVKELIGTESGSELQGYFDSENYNEYRIKVHAMKNNLKTIGATELGEMAYQLELAGKSEDIDFIKQNHAEFCGRYNALMDLLRPMV